MMHRLLERQLRRCEALTAEDRVRLAPLLETVSAAYAQADAERRMLERSLELMSHELLERNEELRLDIEARTTLEGQLRESERRWRSLVHASPSLIGSVDAAGRIADVSRGLAGVAREALLGRELAALVVEPAPAAVAEAIARVRATGAAEAIECALDTGEPAPRDHSLQLLPLRDGQKTGGLLFVATDLSERMRTVRALRESEERFRATFEHAPIGLAIAEPDGTVTMGNAAYAALAGRPVAELRGRSLADGLGEADRARLLERLAALRGSPEAVPAEICTLERPDGTTARARITLVMLARDGAPRALHAIVEDVTGLARAEEERMAMEMQLRQAQKLEAIGQLAAGIAHEINTPTQFIGDNLAFLRRTFEMLVPVLEGARAYQSAPDAPDAHAAVTEALGAVRPKFLLDQVPRALDQSIEGVARVSKIVRAMKEFAHPSGAQPTPTDIHRAIESTLTVARNEWKYVAEVETDFDPALPPVPALADELNQVFLNLIVNAAHAVADARGTSGEMGRIRIATRLDGDQAEIRVEDDGCGIPAHVRDRIFEPFFTTKEVGRGTGQGLAIARTVIVKKHGGTIAVESEVGVGTTMILRLPVRPAHDMEVAA